LFGTSGTTTGTAAIGINKSGEVVGDYDGEEHGFTYSPGGKYATFNVPQSTDTLPAAVISAGIVAGSFVPKKSGRPEGGFLRSP